MRVNGARRHWGVRARRLCRGAPIRRVRRAPTGHGHFTSGPAAGAENPLGGEPRRVFFTVYRPDALGLDGPPPGDGEIVRVWARLLAGMQ